MRRVQLVAVVLATALGAAFAFIVVSPPSSYAQYEDLVTRTKPAVVVVSFKDLFGRGGHGSGFIYDPSGLVLTNHHVSEGATELTVTLPDRRSFPATVVDYIRKNDYACPPRVDTWTDAAVLKIIGTGLPTVPLGDSSTLRQGQEVLVLGYPGGVGTEEVSVSRGIVGAIRAGWFQTDATIIPGNSGGPVVDRDGRVVGLAAFGVGQFFRIGGVVAINSVRPMAQAALTPAGQRFQEFKITGLEYVPAVTVGRKRVSRRAYEPGSAGGQPSASEFSTEVTQVQNFSGSFLYAVRTSESIEARNFLDAEGLHAVSSTGGAWRITHPDLSLTFQFPPCVGLSWQNRWRGENAAEGIVRQAAAMVRIESAGETVSVPAGTFGQAIRIVTLTQGTDVRGNQSQTWRSVDTSWWAPSVGTVREVTENPDTRQRWTDNLLSTSVGPALISPAPPPPPPPPEAAPPPAPAPSRSQPTFDSLIVPGQRISGIAIGMTLNEASAAAISTFGGIASIAEDCTTEKERSEGAFCRIRGWRGEGQRLAAWMILAGPAGQETVSLIVTSLSTHKTESGLGRGATLDDFMRVYGAPMTGSSIRGTRTSAHAGDGSPAAYWPRAGIGVFYGLSDRRVWAIVVFE